MNRKINIEFIRVFAIIFTIVIHVSNVYIYSFDKIDNFNYFISVFFNSMARVCVPLFFMVSGIFLIKEDYDKKKYFARIKKFIIILVVWSIIYFLFNNNIFTSNINILNVLFNSFFNANMTSRHLWFMYAIIGIYIALPFIQNMCKNLNREQENLFLILWILLSGLVVLYVPLARLITKTNVDIEYPIPIINAAYYVGYFISGHILYERYRNIKSDKKKNILYLLGYLIPTLITCLSTYFISIYNGSVYDSMFWYRSIFTIISSFSLFILVIINEDKFQNKYILKLSGLSFGVYLIHVIFLEIIKENFKFINYSSVIIIPVITLLIYIISLMCSYILKKIPVIRKLL